MAAKRRVVLGGLGVVVGGFVVMQLLPVGGGRTNPAVTMDVPAPAEVKAVLRRSCYDCHSNETRWPWYSRVAPVSWRVVRHVEEGRRELNFSEWDKVDGVAAAHLIEEAHEEAASGGMPLGDYLLMHGDARVSAADLEVLRAWAASVREGVLAGE